MACKITIEVDYLMPFIIHLKKNSLCNKDYLHYSKQHFQHESQALNFSRTFSIYMIYSHTMAFVSFLTQQQQRFTIISRCVQLSTSSTLYHSFSTPQLF